MKYFIITLLLVLVPIVGGCILAILDTMWDIAKGMRKKMVDDFEMSREEAEEMIDYAVKLGILEANRRR